MTSRFAQRQRFPRQRRRSAITGGSRLSRVSTKAQSYGFTTPFRPRSLSRFKGPKPPGEAYVRAGRPGRVSGPLSLRRPASVIGIGAGAVVRPPATEAVALREIRQHRGRSCGPVLGRPSLPPWATDRAAWVSERSPAPPGHPRQRDRAQHPQAAAGKLLPDLPRPLQAIRAGTRGRGPGGLRGQDLDAQGRRGRRVGRPADRSPRCRPKRGVDT